MKLFKINFLAISDLYCQLFLRRSNKNSLLFKSKFQYFVIVLLSPQKSMEIQNAISSDIMMQSEDFISSTIISPCVEFAM